MTDIQRKAERFREGNLYAAAVVLADRVKYPPDSLLGEWASLVFDREKTKGDTHVAGPLYKPEAA